MNKVKWFHVFLYITNNSIKHQSFLYTHLNDQTFIFLTIQFSRRYLFALSLNVKQFYLTLGQKPIRCYHSGPEWTWEQWQRRGTLHFSQLQHYWNLTITVFSILYSTFVRRSSPFAEMQSVYSTAPADYKSALIFAPKTYYFRISSLLHHQKRQI